MRTEKEIEIFDQKQKALKARIVSQLNAEGAMSKDGTGHSFTMDALYYLFENTERDVYEFKAMTVELMAALVKHPEFSSAIQKDRNYVPLNKFLEGLYFFFEQLDESKNFDLLMQALALSNSNVDEKHFEGIEKRLDERIKKWEASQAIEELYA